MRICTHYVRSLKYTYMTAVCSETSPKQIDIHYADPSHLPPW